MSAAPTLFDYAEARRDRDQGMAKAALHSPDFAVAAYEAIKAVARRKFEVHANDLLGADIPEPHHPNAWGPVYQKAVRMGILQRTNQVRACRDKRKRLHLSPIYLSLIYDPRGK